MYIDNQKFYDEICKSREDNKFTDHSYRIVRRIVSLNIRKSYPPSMISKCAISFTLVDVEKQLHSFNPEHSAKPNSAFNYFSTISKHSIIKFKRKYKK